MKTIDASYIELQSGEFLNFKDLDPSSIRLEDIAHGLSNLCRFTGHTRTFYSVAQHALLVSKHLEIQGYDRDVCLAGLHHDDSEAFLGDVNKPLKEMLPEYKQIEHETQGIIEEAIDINCFSYEPEVKRADMWALSAEAYHLLPSKGRNWFSWGLYRPDEDEWMTVWELGRLPRAVECAWLKRHHDLVRGR